MAATDMLLKPEDCAMLLVDFQAGLGFSVESIPRQVLLEFQRDWTRHETYEACAPSSLQTAVATEWASPMREK